MIMMMLYKQTHTSSDGSISGDLSGDCVKRGDLCLGTEGVLSLENHRTLVCSPSSMRLLEACGSGNNAGGIPGISSRIVMSVFILFY